MGNRRRNWSTRERRPSLNGPLLVGHARDEEAVRAELSPNTTQGRQPNTCRKTLGKSLAEGQVAGEIPYSNSCVRVSDQPLPVRAETHAIDPSGLAFLCLEEQPREGFAWPHIPNSRRAIAGRSENPLAVGAELGCVDRSAMPHRLHKRLAGLRIPEPSRSVG